MIKEIRVSIVISGENVTEDLVSDALIDMCESKGWQMGGGVEEIKEEP